MPSLFGWWLRSYALSGAIVIKLSIIVEKNSPIKNDKKAKFRSILAFENRRQRFGVNCGEICLIFVTA